jgi:epoxyqueuosine reductase
MIDTRVTATARIKQAVRAAGCDAVGIAPAAAPARMAEFRAALAAGRHADMAWLARPDALATRADPRLLLPGARSLIMVARGYPVPADARGIARYAWQPDYHETLAAALAPVVALVAELGGASRICVDSAPLCEVAHAARAGLGWIGKHTLLLRREGGSWCHLGAIVTDLALDCDQPVPDRCGTCRRCLDSCPTGALVAPYQLDARRCLSYQTIEQRGIFPEELRVGAGRWLFGCDVCQEVCPWCRGARSAGEPPRVDAAQIAALDGAGFNARYRHSPLRRARRGGLLRNLCLALANQGDALGNQGDERAREVLARLARDADPLVAEHARWALTRLAGVAASAANDAHGEHDGDSG